MTLKDLTKDELIFVVNEILKGHWPNQDYVLMRALNEVKYRREVKHLEEAEKYGKIADDKRREYIELVGKYQGIPVMEIPPRVMDKLRKLIREAQEYDDKYLKLMEIGDKKP